MKRLKRNIKRKIIRERKMCVQSCHKLSFNSYNEAIKNIIIRNRYKGKYRIMQRLSKTPKRAYKCENCGFFHLTSQKKKHVEKRTNKIKDAYIVNLPPSKSLEEQIDINLYKHITGDKYELRDAN
jgi:uncharacterized protein